MTFLRRHVLVVGALAFNVLGTVLDDASSYAASPVFFETNPFARDALGRFVPGHALAYQAAWLAILLAVGVLIYLGLRRFSEVIAQVGFSAWFIYDGIGSYAATIHNLWLYLGWFVPNGALR